MLAALLFCLCANGHAQSSPTSDARPQAQPASQTPIILDRVIAIVNGDVLLESDVREEMRVAVLQPLSVPPGQNTEVNAAQRLIRRALILEQMRAQQQIDYRVSDDEVKKSLAELRAQIPICRQIHCSTEEGWNEFLKSNGITEQEAEERWRQRLEILKFINIRFGTGIRISRQDIQKYYQATVVPAFEKMKEKPPTLESVTPRIQEILLQQQVNSLLRDWLQSLRQQGSVQILDPAYGQSSNADEDEGGGA
ncbi:peptidylprolyl isomerase [Alloacidobacterium dinghuense]|uniref:Peptidylprolyl isomerase n=1 Tax=Alloacidobacterium dinghuense TaxID=2763107 RepID=A0A7G8BM50_9BACT|nr:peptidylprolyl isomerase [Alloacidobacterium dinghuense]QNI33620.1 peptidylprolyl isomerase [Alloacidobacterium dinghuense]